MSNAAKFVAVAVTEHEADGNIVVRINWISPVVDRPEGMGWSVGKDTRLADRLARAITSQAAVPNPKVLVDVNGKTYIYSDMVIFGRRMNADLKRLGY